MCPEGIVEQERREPKGDDERRVKEIVLASLS